MICELYIRKKSKSIRDLINKYLLSKRLLEKKLKHSYKVRLRHLKLLLLLQLSRSSQLLKQSYAANFAAVVVTLWGIELTNVLIVLVVSFLYIICVWLRNCDLKSISRPGSGKSGGSLTVAARLPITLVILYILDIQLII